MRHALCAVFIVALCCAAHAGEHVLHAFDRRQLTDVYYSEGVAAGDINGDGYADVVYGPYWFQGPEFQEKHEIYAARPQPRERYADHFFAWVYDFNGDGWNDVFAVGFPGTPAHVYENPGGDQLDQLWKKHQVFDSVANESPHFVDLAGDERPELVCTNGGYFGFAAIDWKKPFEPWSFRAVSEKVAPPKFGHGLGVGDVNGDGRLDILHSKGWFEQPAGGGEGPWTAHAASFTDSYGGAEMHCYDVDGDGDNDVITSLAAHDFGLAWFEQTRGEDGAISFRQHRIMGDRPEHNRYGLVFSELHSLTLADIDGDGLKDIVTGKTYWSHHTQSPMWDAGAVVYWFRLLRTPDGVDWVPYRADGEAGIGRQIVVHDLDGDKRPDLLAGGMKGAHVLLHRTRAVDEAVWRDAQPKPYDGPATSLKRGPASPIDERTGRVANALEGESLKVLETTAGRTTVQKMSGFRKDRWSGDAQLFWTGAKPGDRVRLELPVPDSGTYALGMGLTMARDYAIVQLRLDGEPLGDALDLYHAPDVVTTGLLDLGEHDLAAGKHELAVEITGANPSAAKAYMVGLDFVRITQTGAARSSRD